jgi:hypothetical protein
MEGLEGSATMYLTLRPPGYLVARWSGMRVLIAMGNDYWVYREVMAGCLNAMRPHLEVVTASPEDFEEHLESFKPLVVICGGRDFARTGEPLAWMDLAFDSVVPLERPAQIWVGCCCREMSNPGVEDLITVIDEVALVRDSGRSV